MSVSVTLKLAQREYKNRHEILQKWFVGSYARNIIWKRYEHMPDKVSKKDNVKLLWDNEHPK